MLALSGKVSGFLQAVVLNMQYKAYYLAIRSTQRLVERTLPRLPDPHRFIITTQGSRAAGPIRKPEQSEHRKIGHEAVMSIIACNCASSIHIPNVDGLIYAGSTASRDNLLAIRGPCHVKDVCQQAGMTLINRERLSCSRVPHIDFCSISGRSYA